MARMRSFETAAARRRKDPIVWDIDGQQIRLVSSLELLDLADLIEALQTPVSDTENSLKAAAKKRLVLLDIVARFVMPDSKAGFQEVSTDLDIHILSEMVQDLIEEYSGAKNPTKPSLSSDGSETTSVTSTDGAPPEESTPSA
jgi:hypothetical protein